VSAASAALPRPGHRGTDRRLLTIAGELALAIAICVVGYFYAAEWFQVREAAWTVQVLQLLGVDASGVVPGSILIFRGPDEVLEGIVTLSCSSVLSVGGLVALTAVVLRGRGPHALFGLVVAAVAVVAANLVRLVLSALAGWAWGGPAMTLFHDWAGTLWALASTLGGFLLMVCLTLPAAERAEQDVAGRHTARRPQSWARPGLGYRSADVVAPPAGSRPRLASFVHRRVLPRRLSAHLAARRESGRIDYRIGHQPVDRRIATVQRLAADGLGAHSASLVAVATYDDDERVLEALALAIAARQWEPITDARVSALRLWARGWMQASGHRDAGPRPRGTRGAHAAPDGAATAPRPTPAPQTRGALPTPLDFARPHPEDLP